MATEPATVSVVETFAGTSENSLFGTVVVMRDSLVFVGAPENESGSGKIIAYDMDTSSVVWELTGEPEESLGSQFSVSDDGSRIAVARGASVLVYSIEKATGLAFINGSPIFVALGANFVTLSSDGARLAVSDDYNADLTGRVTIYEYSSDDGGEWTVDEEVLGDVPRAHYGAITSFSRSGNRLAIGASNQSVEPLFRNGLVRVVEKTPSGAWMRVGQDLVGDIDLDQLGTSIALSGDGYTVIAGSENSHGQGRRQGFVNVYRQDATQGGNWTQVGHTLYGENDLDRLGRSVAVIDNGRRIAATSYFHNSQRGQVLLYDLGGDGEWEQVVELEGDEVMDRMGHGRMSLSISPYGDRIAVGVTQADSDGGVQVGSVWVLDLSVPEGVVVTAVSAVPSVTPSVLPSAVTSASPSSAPSSSPSAAASASPTVSTSALPSAAASDIPTVTSSVSPSAAASDTPTAKISSSPSLRSSGNPSESPSFAPSKFPTYAPTVDDPGYAVVGVSSVNDALTSSAASSFPVILSISSVVVATLLL